MITLAIASGLLGGIIMYGVRGWEQRAIERLNATDTSPHALSSLVDAEHDEYEQAAHGDGFADEADVLGLMQALNRLDPIAADGCFVADHVLGACRHDEGKVVPLRGERP